MDLMQTVEQIYEHFFAGDLDGVMAFAAPDVVVRQDPALPWGGHYVGRDGVAEFGLALAATLDTSVTTDQLFAAGDSVVQVGRSRGTVRATGEAYDVAECHVWTFRDGLVVDVQFFVDSTAITPALAR